MLYYQILESLPEQMRRPMADLVEAVQKDMREQLAVRRQDFDELQAAVRSLAETQKRTGRRLEAAVHDLAEAQKRTEQQMADLAEAQKRTEQQMADLAEAQKHTEQQMAGLADAQKSTEHEVRFLMDKVSAIDGWTLEQAYRDKASAYFGPLLRRLRVVSPHTLEDTLEARLTREEFLDVLRLDLLVTGTARRAPVELAEAEVWLAVEVSATVDREDVRRAHQRAAELRKAGYRAVPVVAGRELTMGAEEQARASSVLLLEDGKISWWEEALQAWGMQPSSEIEEL